MKNIKLIIATHKQFQMPKDRQLYLPIHVGREGKNDLGYQGDNTGENISNLNPYYCELTGLYWAWKNLDVDYLGLVHYRRYFARKTILYKENTDINQVILNQEDVEKQLERADVIVPKKRRYYIETLYSHYSNTHDSSHLDETRKVISELTPNYLTSYDKVMKQNSGYMFNMFIMSKELTDRYCSWLFPIIKELYERIDVSEYTPFEARLFGRISELLFNVWIVENELTVKEMPFIYMDKVDFIRKLKSFLFAKFFNQKYGKSF